MNIKKLIILLFLTLVPRAMCFSQNTLNGIEKDSIVWITPEQLKETNLIFLEHHKLLKENSLLNTQVSNFKKNNELLIKKDSLNTSLIKEYQNIYDVKIQNLDKEIKKKDNLINRWKAGGISATVLMFVLYLIK